MRNAELVSWVTHELSSPRSLQHLARSRIRTSMVEQIKGRGIGKAVDSLPLPRKMREFLMFKDEIECEEESEADD